MIFKDKIAVVTGGSRGIGKAIIMELAKNGANIAFNYYKREDEARIVIDEVKKMGREILSYQTDIKNFQQIKDMMQNIKKNLGNIDFLVNNAGIIRDKALAMMTEEDWNEVIQTNLTGVFNCCKAVIVDFMKQKKGNIVNITSISGIVGLPRQVNYSASKAGIIGFTKSLAKEVSAYNIRVNAIAPGAIETDMMYLVDEKTKEELIKKIPMAYFGKPEMIAKVVRFFLSDDAQYITGQVISVDGGLNI